MDVRHLEEEQSLLAKFIDDTEGYKNGKKAAKE